MTNFLSLTFEKHLNLINIMKYKQEEPSKEFYENNKDIIAKRFSLFIEGINIGKMIEILELKSNCTQQIINEGGMYCITINPKQGYITAWETEYYNELCDALFEAIVKIL